MRDGARQTDGVMERQKESEREIDRWSEGGTDRLNEEETDRKSKGRDSQHDGETERERWME